jgi:hypothetical protein
VEVEDIDCKCHLEVLSDAPHHRTEGTLHLPIDSIIESVQQYYGLVTNQDILVTQQFHKDLLDQMQGFFIVMDLGYEKVGL